MKRIVLKIGSTETVKALHEDLQHKLELPAYYGHNLDALHDALTEIAENTEIQVVCEEAVRESSAYLLRFMRVLEDAAQENPNLILVR